ncbi:MAG: putative DNA-binding transcriptional regulator [Bacteroidetes bacterium ADurb.Bin408]|nr:MAG: putative DNA-binding transcriptional regulator [Bacteroidetes bacterium ADurb.Bin408]
MATEKYRRILVYADWKAIKAIKHLGVLKVQRVRGKEVFSFEYDSLWLRSEYAQRLDPHLGLYQGKQYAPDDKPNFGLFLDSSPDRWGRMLMRRREAAMAKREKRAEQTLYESDFLLGVYDGHRLGGLRFKLEEEGDFLNNQKEMASPPWTTLRELEYASLQIERDDTIDNPEYFHWLSLLFAPGSSLGGARPKASVLDEGKNLWIAKFPSIHDKKNTGAWEMVLHEIARKAEIDVPQAKLLNLSGKQHIYLSKRFDRSGKERIHFASAMTLLGYNDGADTDEGVSYLELLEFIQRSSPESKKDMAQLWRRIVFNILVSNTDDHLRNHGFLLTPSGWRLSPAFDMNPNPYGSGLSLNISETDNALDTNIALDVAKYFKLSENEASTILKKVISAVSEWRTIAKAVGIASDEVESMKKAFRV